MYPVQKAVSYTEVRAKLASILDQATDTLEPILVTRRGKRNVALLDAAELSSIMETLHLLSSPANAHALFESLEQARRGQAIPLSLAKLKARTKKAGGKASR